MGAPVADASLHQQMGELIASQRAILEDLRRIEDKIQRSDDKSDESRAKMHRRIDDAVGAVGEVKATVAGLEKDVKEMKPVTDDVRRWKLMGIGALGMMGIGGVALGVSFADALKRIAGLLIGR
ncbi:hypothetical protein GCM10007923_63410 [Shinella yambaruensis]|uniref:DUF1515 domain-containing protein n=1 Tax=Shinella yambaruensis TaxID=415996 RepID=A0ABQ5ZQJ0_9HYPH|nr:DUF1515 family protein [Shinella yambaruensis]GLR55120.1 hypothetical protein GCM10007923_63410 [Shinella yambaruensis]